jgi:hypothetical protein
MENTMQQFMDSVLSLSDDIRYVAVYRNGQLSSSNKAGRKGASSSESDTYEELIVNPAILTLVKQRGDIDCGGARFVLIRYGNFYQIIAPIDGGHVSVCIESEAEPLKLVEPIQSLLSRYSVQ